MLDTDLPSWLRADAEGIFTGAALDTETTGLSSDADHIIEIGIRLFRFELPSGRITETVGTLSALQDPGFAISREIQSITGLTPTDLSGQSIEWGKVDELLSQADVLIAHNAQFDRSFVDKKSAVSGSQIWGCSAWQVDWRAKGFKNARLPDLCAALGIVFQAHRAMSDVQAMTQLLALDDALTGKPYFCELINSVREPMAYLWVEGRTYDQRELLKAHRFKWNPGARVWGKIVPASEAPRAAEFAQALIPGAVAHSHVLAVRDRFKPLELGAALQRA